MVEPRFVTLSEGELGGMIEAAVLAEREACARLAEEFPGEEDGQGRPIRSADGEEIAVAIRARGEGVTDR